MKKLIMALLLASGFAFPQGGNPPYPVTANRVARGAGAPLTGCSVAADRGKVYIRTDAGAVASSLYACVNTTGSTTAWELQSGGGGGSPASPANSIQFNNAGAFGGFGSYTSPTFYPNVVPGTSDGLAKTMELAGEAIGTPPSFNIRASNGFAPIIRGIFDEGSLATPSNVSGGDQLLVLSAYGFLNAAFRFSSQIEYKVQDTVMNNVVGLINLTVTADDGSTNSVQIIGGDSPSKPTVALSGFNLNVGGAVALSTDAPVGSASAAVCWKTTTTLSYCTSAVGAGGTCTCN